MSWFDSAGLAGFAKTALTSAQKKIDKVLDIEEDDASATSKASATSRRVSSGGGGGGFGPYSFYDAAKTTPASLNADDDVGDWGSQSTLWSSWFDFGKDPSTSEADKKNMEKPEALNRSDVVAAQPPIGRSSELAKGPSLVLTGESRLSSNSFFVEEDVQEPLSHKDDDDNDNDSKVSTSSVKVSRPPETRKPKSRPKNLGLRKSREDESGSSSSVQNVNVAKMVTSDDLSLVFYERPPTDSHGEPIVELPTLPTQPIGASRDDDGLVDPRASAQSLLSPSTTSNDFSPFIAESSLSASQSSAALSASVCWEVSADDAEVDAILRKNDSETDLTPFSSAIQTPRGTCEAFPESQLGKPPHVDQTVSREAPPENPSCDSVDLTLTLTRSSKEKLTDSSTTESTIEPEEDAEEKGEEEQEDKQEDKQEGKGVEEEEEDVSLSSTKEAASPLSTPKRPLPASSADSPKMTTGVASVVRDLLGDAMTESLRASSASSEGVSTRTRTTFDSGDVDGEESSDADGAAASELRESGRGSCAIGSAEWISGYASSDDHHTPGGATSDEREETGTSSDIEIISNPSCLDGEAPPSRFDASSPLRSFHGSIDASDVIFHHQSLMQLQQRREHRRTPSQSSSELKIETARAATSTGSDDSPFESPHLAEFDGDVEDEAEGERERSAALVRQRLQRLHDEETAASTRQRPQRYAELSGEDDAGNKTPRASRSRKSSDRYPSVTQGGGEDDEAVAYEKNEVVNELIQKMNAMAEVIQARETNAFELSKMNAELTETATNLRQQLAQAVAARDAAHNDASQMKDEFARRLGELEHKLRSTAQDRDAVKRDLNQALKDLQANAALEAIVKEKEDLVQELMTEGTKLSQQLGSANTALRKLRAKEKESEVVLTKKKERVETSERRVAELEAEQEELKRSEKSRISQLEQMEERCKLLESELLEARSKIEDDEAKIGSLKVSLEAANREIVSLKAHVLECDSLVAEAEGRSERETRRAMAREFERAQETLLAERDALAASLEDLRVYVGRHERDQARREDVLRQEIAGLQQRLQEADIRNQELVESMGGATLPLLRQIESLKMTMVTQTSSWEAVEENLNGRLAESQEQVAVAEEKERVSAEELFELRGKMSQESSRCSSLTAEKALLKTEVETLKSKLSIAEEAKASQAMQISSVKSALTQEINELKKVKIDLETRVQQLTGKVVDLEQSRRTRSPPPSPRRSSTPRPPSSPPPSIHSLVAASSAPSLYSAIRDSGSSSLQFEEMQSQLKQKDGEICQLQTDIMNLELTRESMANELVQLSNTNSTLEESVKDYPRLKNAYLVMEERYNAMLQMYGEKVEEFDELRMDLEHVKSMYKTQIEELLQKTSFR